MRLYSALLTAASISVFVTAAPAGAYVHLIETPSTCGDASARVVNHYHLLVSAQTLDDESNAGFLVGGINGIPVAPFSFDTTNCNDELTVIVLGTFAPSGTFSINVSGCSEFTQRTLSNGVTRITFDPGKIVSGPSPSFSQIFIGYSNGQTSGLLGNFVLQEHGGISGIPNTHFSQSNTFCSAGTCIDANPGACVKADQAVTIGN